MIIRIKSHRAREWVFRTLGQKLQGLFNMHNTGLYEVTNEQFEKVKDIPSVSKSRIPRSELMECWAWR